jgi:AraC-like DNA-binding protein
MIDLCNQACEGMKMNQGRDAYQTIFSNILKTLLNLGKSESLFLFLYDENLAHILSHYFYQLQDYPEIQILIMRLSARLCSKVLMINHFMKHGLVLEIVKNVGFSSSSYFIKACVETITSFARQPQFVRSLISLKQSDEYTESLAHLIVFRIYNENEDDYPVDPTCKNMKVSQRIFQMRCVLVKIISYILNLQSKPK